MRSTCNFFQRQPLSAFRLQIGFTKLLAIIFPHPHKGGQEDTNVDFSLEGRCDASSLPLSELCAQGMHAASWQCPGWARAPRLCTPGGLPVAGANWDQKTRTPVSLFLPHFQTIPWPGKTPPSLSRVSPVCTPRTHAGSITSARTCRQRRAPRIPTRVVPTWVAERWAGMRAPVRDEAGGLAGRRPPQRSLQSQVQASGVASEHPRARPAHPSSQLIGCWGAPRPPQKARPPGAPAASGLCICPRDG